MIGWRARVRKLTASRFVRDTLWLQAAKIATVLLSFGSSLLVWRLMGPERYGAYGLAVSFLSLVHTLDLSGLGTSTASRLAVAVGAADREEARNLLAFHFTWMTIVHVGLAGLIALVGRPLAEGLSGGAHIADLALLLAGALYLDGVYTLIVTALQARRAMRTAAVLSVVNQAVLSAALIAAAASDPRAEALIAGRTAYGAITLALAIGVYAASRTTDDLLPTFGVVLRRVGRVPGGRYWRFGLANAIDKNLAEWLVLVPVQLAGAIGGSAAAGYLGLAQTAITNAGILTSALFENLRTVIPQAVGRRDYATLWRGLRVALVGLFVGGLVLYGVVALGTIVLVPLLLGPEWLGAQAAVLALTLYGVVTTVAGVFGPVYRAFEWMAVAIRAKLAAVIVLAAAVFALAALPPLAPDLAAALSAGLIGLLFAIQAALTGLAVVPRVRALALNISAAPAAPGISP